MLKAWLASHKPLILCGPPGSGKTMTLTSTLQAMPNLVLASLNFSSSTDPNLILQVIYSSMRAAHRAVCFTLSVLGGVCLVYGVPVLVVCLKILEQSSGGMLSCLNSVVGGGAERTRLPPYCLCPQTSFARKHQQAFQQHCEYVRTPRGVVLQPMASLGLDKWLVVFCDEINLPEQVRRTVAAPGMYARQ